MLAHELGVPASAVDPNLPFPELGLDSMMSMTILREAKKLLGIELSLTMFWNDPTIASLAAQLAELGVPREQSEEEQPDSVDMTMDSAGSLLDDLFASVESAPAGTERSI